MRRSFQVLSKKTINFRLLFRVHGLQSWLHEFCGAWICKICEFLLTELLISLCTYQRNDNSSALKKEVKRAPAGESCGRQEQAPGSQRDTEENKKDNLGLAGRTR